ncbi:hypothetical protein [uncultured Chryseobacterium sp.]|uniref:hypothetical protein n=1 Tax=uncultured Chryseobacterium sp. TaxID=259322 RepID=UPI0026333DCB|nr:hypothetical protein [uncultured Chryseobacterium sp.]
MKNLNKLFLSFLAVIMIAVSCEKKEEKSDLETLRTSNNRKSYPVTKMDSAQAIQFITKQKIQELFDLSTLYANGNRDTEIDSVIYAQMQNYFEKPDSTKLKPIIQQLDSLQVNTAKVGNIAVSKKISGKDTLDFAQFNVEYFDQNNKSIGSFNKNAQYVLKLAPVQFKKEFKFYFVKFDVEMPKDSTSSGVTK